MGRPFFIRLSVCPRVLTSLSGENKSDAVCLFHKSKVAGCSRRDAPLVKTDLNVGPVLEMDGVDETDLALVECENHGRSANAVAKETNTFEKIAVGDAEHAKIIFLPGARSAVS